jgi:hypothetical protein
MRHRLTKKEKLKGIKRALKNPRTPKQFLAGLQNQLLKLLK